MRRRRVNRERFFAAKAAATAAVISINARTIVAA
jgi:hypothetical protein